MFKLSTTPLAEMSRAGLIVEAAAIYNNFHSAMALAAERLKTIHDLRKSLREFRLENLRLRTQAARLPRMERRLEKLSAGLAGRPIRNSVKDLIK